MRVQARSQELRAVGFAQIQSNIFGWRLVAGRLHVEPLERIGLFAGARLIEVIGGISELGAELGDKVGGDFVAARANGGADGRKKMRRLAAEFEGHAANGFLRDASQRAAPSGMDGGDGALFWIHQKNRHAIGGLHTKKNARLAGGRGVAFAWIRRCLWEEMNHVGMDLFEGRELEIRGVQGRLKLAAVFEDGFARVPFHEAKIQNFFGCELAGAAGARAEAVDEPREFAEGFEFKDLQAAGFAKTPGRFDHQARRGRACAGAKDLVASRSGMRRFPCGHDLTSIIGALRIEKAAGRAKALDLRYR